jgi:hypothetical protein
MLQIPLVITKKDNTSEAKPTMCISFANEGKTQVGWVVAIG